MAFSADAAHNVIEEREIALVGLGEGDLNIALAEPCKLLASGGGKNACACTEVENTHLFARRGCDIRSKTRRRWLLCEAVADADALAF